MSRLMFAVPLVALLALTGCAAQGSPEPTASEAPNADACLEFGDATVAVGNSIELDELGELDIPAKFDEALLVAEGDVKERIQALIDGLPEPAHMLMWMDNATEYTDAVNAVVRACESADLETGPVAVLERTGGPFPTVIRE